MIKSQKVLKRDTLTKVKEPKMYKIIFYNDDITPMDFVVEILIKFFNKTVLEATEKMMEVHKSGSSVIAIYTYDIAYTKKIQCDQVIQQYKYPLKISVEEQ